MKMMREINCSSLGEIFAKATWNLKRFGGKIKLADHPTKLQLGVLHEKTGKWFLIHFGQFYRNVSKKEQKLFRTLLTSKQNRLDFVERINNSVKAK